MNRVKPKRIFGGVKKRKESPLLRSIREWAEQQAAVVIAQPMAHERMDQDEVAEALSDPVRVRVSDPVAVSLEEIEAKRSRHTYNSGADLKVRDAIRKLATQADSNDEKRPYVAPNKDALDMAAWYLAGVVCHINEHHVPTPPWPYEFPCKLCFSWAIDRLHDLGSHRFPKQEIAHGKEKRGKNPGEKARRGRVGRPSGKPVRD